MQQERRDVERAVYRGRERIAGYFGMPGDTAADARRAIEAQYPDWEGVASTTLPGADGDLAAFVSWPSHHPSVAHATNVDGSYVAIAGAVHSGPSLQEILDRWLKVGDRAFADLYFHGFVVAWNSATGDFALIRDRYGVAAGYYTLTESGVFFADEQRALVGLGADNSPNAAALDAFLVAGYFPAPLTPYESIAKLAPGSVVRFRNGSVVTESYVSYDPSPLRTFDEALALAEDRMKTSIERLWPESGDVGLLEVGPGVVEPLRLLAGAAFG